MAPVASPRVLEKPVLLIQDRGGDSAALRLLSAERSEEIFPILLEEIVKIGFPRALVLEVDFDNGDVKATASLNCDRNEMQKFHTSLWARDNPIMTVLQRLSPGVLPNPTGKGASFYAYPMIYRSGTRCWEAERERREDCLAVQNARLSRHLPLEGQVCSACGMRAYATLVLAQLGKDTPPARLDQLRNLAERANSCLARLFKIEHYFNRMRDMEVTISRLSAVMQSMADPVIFTDDQHRVVIQNRAAERFFRVPEGIGDGGRRAVELNRIR